MKSWFNKPPCNPLNVKSSGPRTLELEGPVLAQKVAGGVAAAFGAGFAAVAFSFLKAPFPAPFKLIPLAMGAVGTGLSAAGAFGVISRQSVRVDAGRGVTFRWKPGPLEPRELVVKAADVAALEVVHQVERHSAHDGSMDSTSDVYRLSLVTRDGRELPIERFGTRTQATLRKAQIEHLLAAKPEAKTAQRKEAAQESIGPSSGPGRIRKPRSPRRRASSSPR